MFKKKKQETLRIYSVSDICKLKDKIMSYDDAQREHIERAIFNIQSLIINSDMKDHIRVDQSIFGLYTDECINYLRDLGYKVTRGVHNVVDYYIYWKGDIIEWEVADTAIDTDGISYNAGRIYPSKLVATYHGIPVHNYIYLDSPGKIKMEYGIYDTTFDETSFPNYEIDFENWIKNNATTIKISFQNIIRLLGKSVK